jgi:hypothetical protein
MKQLLHLLLLISTLLAGCASSAPPAPKPAASDADSDKKPPLVVQNPDGTLTIQKEPSKSDADNGDAKKGLVIPPQVIAPTALPPEKRN